MKHLACVLAFSVLGTCHDRHRDVSERLRSGQIIEVKDSTEHVMKSVGDTETIAAVAAFMAQHADSWSGEDIFGGVPTSELLLEVRNRNGDLLIGLSLEGRVALARPT